MGPVLSADRLPFLILSFCSSISYACVLSLMYTVACSKGLPALDRRSQGLHKRKTFYFTCCLFQETSLDHPGSQKTPPSSDASGCNSSRTYVGVSLPNWMQGCFQTFSPSKRSEHSCCRDSKSSRCLLDGLGTELTQDFPKEVFPSSLKPRWSPDARMVLTEALHG